MVAFTTPVDVTPATTLAWTDVDVSAHIPAGHAGVILACLADAGATRDIGLRKNGSTDSRVTGFRAECLFIAAIGVDAGRVFEAYIENIAQKIYLLGSFAAADAVFFTNAIDKFAALGTTGWQDVDISADTGADTATGAFVEAVSSAASILSGVRRNGSTDNRTNDYLNQHLWYCIGCDGSEIFEAYRASTSLSGYLVGYTIANIAWNTNAIDRSLTTTGAYADLATLPAGAIGGLYEIDSSSVRMWALRKKGATYDHYGDVVQNQAHAIVECDASRLVEGKIEATAVDFWELGYITAAAAAAGGAPFLRRDHPALLSQVRR